ncbi:hypothetical protein OE88DRAFT_1630583 [Heliocybe sulcata]|uniref:Mannosyltransferase n=1 Tax=Heliocybe sulcata TaxID=5364 RepID=A0A5C3N158_9AGAM|nr:hypothetical protein OE88DRAFT_1630583 [Heliocybe sulcata]
MPKFLTRLYTSFVMLRIFCAFWGTGYIHPDEYFQNGEVTAGDVLGFHVIKSWEWDPTAPCRAVLPPFITTGVAFATAKLAGLDVLIMHSVAPNPRMLFFAERFMFLLLSFVLDFAATRLVPNPQSRSYALLLISSSHVANAFQVRPFSNSLESLALSVSLVLLRSLLENHRQRHLNLLALVFVLGAFTRITFLASALPIGLQALTWISKQSAGSITSWLRLVVLPLGTAILTGLSLLCCDTLYFHGSLSAPVLTPLNFLLYNLSSKVAEEHGAHPRWLHVAVNLPMIVGPGLIYYSVRAISKDRQTTSSREDGKVKDNVNTAMSRTIAYTVVITLAVLSVPQHQEPRFLIPLLLPVVVLVVNSGQIYRAGKIFWVTSVFMNVALTALFGFLHQAGVVPSLFYVHGRISEEISLYGHLDVVYWRTYMPPRHLLGIRHDTYQDRSVSVTDIAGASTDVLLETIRHLISSADSRRPDCSKVYLVAPFWATDRVDLNAHGFILEHRVWPHLDMDHLGESVSLGVTDGLVLGVYSSQQDCALLGNGRL